MAKRICLTMLLVLLCSVMNARTVSRCYNEASKKFCVRVDGTLMTVAEYDNWLYQIHPSEYVSDTVLAYWMKRHLGDWPTAHTKNYRNFTFSTRTMQWADKELVAWVVIDDTGHECSHWFFAGSDETSGGYWWFPEAGLEEAVVVLQLCADTLCWVGGKVDRNGKLYLMINEGEYIPWDWSRVDEY